MAKIGIKQGKNMSEKHYIYTRHRTNVTVSPRPAALKIDEPEAFYDSNHARTVLYQFVKFVTLMFNRKFATAL